MTYRVVHIPSGHAEHYTELHRAAILAQLNEEEILWAIEEHGLCETDEHVITEEDEQ